MGLKIFLLGLLTIFAGCSENEARETEGAAGVEMKQESMNEPVDPVEEVTLKKARYRLTFTSLWDKGDHLGRPGNAHFSPIVLTVHNEGHRLLPI